MKVIEEIVEACPRNELTPTRQADPIDGFSDAGLQGEIAREDISSFFVAVHAADTVTMLGNAVE